ncbi:MAG: hypothetical protein ABSB00_01415 [Minisyncoccia bacterium]
MEKPPIAVQEVALAEFHVSVEDWPLLMVLGLAESVAVGAEHVGGLFAPFIQTPLMVVQVG